MQAQLQIAETLQFCEGLGRQVFRAQETLAYILFIFGALTAVLYGLISDRVDRSPTAWRKAGWKALCGFSLLVALWLLSGPLHRFFVLLRSG